MSKDDGAIVLDGAAVMRMAGAGIVVLWNEGGVLMGRDHAGKVFAFPSSRDRSNGKRAGVAQ